MLTWTGLIRLLMLLLVIGAVVIGVLYRDEISVAGIEARVEALGVWAPLVFMGFYALGAVVFLPGSVFTIAGGALFGPVFGTGYNLLGATVGATLAFLIARYGASDLVARKTGGRLKKIITGVEEEGWRFVAFTRLVPIFPFNLLNYALGLTRIGTLPYMLATFICMFPGALAYTWIGHAGREAIAGGEGMIQTILIALGLLAVVFFLPRLVRRIRKAPIPGEEHAEPAQQEDSPK